MSRYAEIEKALRNLELGANTIDRCYSHRPENFAAALRDLREYAELARAALALPAQAEVEDGALTAKMREAGIDPDVDTMHDVYMTTEQRAAFNRLRDDAMRYRAFPNPQKATP